MCLIMSRRVGCRACWRPLSSLGAATSLQPEGVAIASVQPAQLRAVLIVVFDRATMIGEHLACKIQLSLRHHRSQHIGQFIRRKVEFMPSSLFEVTISPPQGMVMDVLSYPVELGL